MTENDNWAHLAKRDVPDDEMDVLIEADNALGPDWTSPTTVVGTFIAGLDDVDTYRNALETLVVPESLPAWGDFTTISRNFRAIQNWGIGSVPNQAVDRPDVVYVKILSGVTQSFEVLEADLIIAAGMFTLVFSKQRGMWLIFAFGDPVHPDAIPAVA